MNSPNLKHLLKSNSLPALTCSSRFSTRSREHSSKWPIIYKYTKIVRALLMLTCVYTTHKKQQGSSDLLNTLLKCLSVLTDLIFPVEKVGDIVWCKNFQYSPLALKRFKSRNDPMSWACCNETTNIKTKYQVSDIRIEHCRHLIEKSNYC